MSDDIISSAFGTFKNDLASGADVRTVSKRLGHADTSITLNLYSHALKSKDNDAAEKLEDMLSISQKIS